MHERIAAETQALLDRPDVAGYCVLWVARARGRGPRSSLPAAPVPGQSGFETRAADEPALGAGAVRAVADALLEVLEEEPREPVMLNLAGVARYELGALGPAERLFKAALRLDPALPQVRRNLDEIARRRRADSGLGALPAPVRVALPRLGARAESCAARARPAQGLTMSLCMILKDEQEMLPRCLEAPRPAVDEIVLVDTGSNGAGVHVSLVVHAISRPAVRAARIVGEEGTLVWDWSGHAVREWSAAAGEWVEHADPPPIEGPGAEWVAENM